MEYSRYEQPSWRPQEAAATNTDSALKWLLVGIGIGAGVALLLAPNSGRELRGKIGRGFGQTWSGLAIGTKSAERVNFARGLNVMMGRNILPIFILRNLKTVQCLVIPTHQHPNFLLHFFCP
jgi:hypothetical protein